MLIVSNQFLDRLPSIPSVDTIIFRSTRCESKERVDQHFSTILSFNTIGEQVSSPLYQVESNFFSQTLVCLLAETLHNVAQLESAATINFVVSSFHEHLIESGVSALWLELGCSPLKLTNLLECEQV